MVTASALALALAACGGGGAGNTSAGPTADPPAEPATESAPTAPASGGSGTITVNGESQGISLVRNCIPYDAPEFGGRGDPDDLDLTVFGEDGTTGLNIDVAYQDDRQDPSGVVYDFVRLDVLLSLQGTQAQFDGGVRTNPDGEWEIDGVDGLGIPLDEAPFTLEGNRISGSLSLIQSWPQETEGTAEAGFDLTFPSEAVDCRTGG